MNEEQREADLATRKELTEQLAIANSSNESLQRVVTELTYALQRIRYENERLIFQTNSAVGALELELERQEEDAEEWKYD